MELPIAVALILMGLGLFAISFERMSFDGINLGVEIRPEEPVDLSKPVVRWSMRILGLAAVGYGIYLTWPKSSPVPLPSAPTATSTVTPMPTRTLTVTPSPTSTPAATPTSTVTPSRTLTATPMSTPTPSSTPTPTPASTPTASPTATATATSTPTPIEFDRPLIASDEEMVEEFLKRFPERARAGRTIEELAETHGVDVKYLEQANSILDATAWRAEGNEAIIVPEPEREMLEGLMEETVDSANNVQYQVITGDLDPTAEEFNRTWGTQPVTVTRRFIKYFQTNFGKLPSCALHGSIVPQLVVNEPNWLIGVTRERWDYYFEYDDDRIRRDSWTWIELYQFERTEASGWRLTFYKAVPARAHQPAIEVNSLPLVCVR